MLTATIRTRALLGVLAWMLLSAVPARAAEPFPLRDGDTWVMVGDSITAQHLHSNYFEAFCYARYPQLTFHFRNSGVGGDTIPKVLARYDWDVAPWKPTVVSVELGMNDKGGFPVDKYIANMGELTDKIKSGGARPIFFTASPINSGDTSAKLGGNASLDAYAVALKKFAAEKNAPFADQFHALIDVWGKNKPRENVANLTRTIEGAIRDPGIKGIEHLQAFLTVQAQDPNPPVSMQGDPVHPGSVGQLMMAAALLQALGAEGFVSSAKLDGAGKVLEAKGCTVENVQAQGGKLAFDRLDESLPFPIPDEARPGMPLFPAILELSQYTLQVTGLASGKYKLSVNGKPVAALSAQELAAGVNLTAYDKGPIAEQGKAILAQVNNKEGLVGSLRGASKAAASGQSAAGQLEKLAEEIAKADAQIRKAATPVRLRFELQPAE